MKFQKSKILIGQKLLENFEKFFLELFKPCKLLIISDSNTSKLFAQDLKNKLSNINFKTNVLVIKAGERYKNLETLEKIYEYLSLYNMSRFDAIVAVGGGVVTDLSGFAAATYNRGINFVTIPTSFLAMIDASIGGKNGVNLCSGKNLVGTFYYPKLILIDIDVLKTLPQKELNSGISEVTKYGVIWDKHLFEILEKKDFICNLDKIIYKSILVKKYFIEKDEFDTGERMILNFGHTIGHALEKIYSYNENIPHGQAIAIGMNMITKISESMGLTEKGTLNRLSYVCDKYSLPIEKDLHIEKICKAILMDKKILNGFLNFVLLKNIGNAFIYKLPVKKIRTFMEGKL